MSHTPILCDRRNFDKTCETAVFCVCRPSLSSRCVVSMSWREFVFCRSFNTCPRLSARAFGTNFTCSTKPQSSVVSLSMRIAILLVFDYFAAVASDNILTGIQPRPAERHPQKTHHFHSTFKILKMNIVLRQGIHPPLEACLHGHCLKHRGCQKSSCAHQRQINQPSMKNDKRFCKKQAVCPVKWAVLQDKTEFWAVH